MSKNKIYNHISPGLSEREYEMQKHIPEGGNWQNIPDSIPSKRLTNIRLSGGRSTYYGRLRWDKPSYTITTYFNRLGNGCNLHPKQDRIISIREGARLQSFPDHYKFLGSRTSQYKQIGNAVPPLLAYQVASKIKEHISNKNYIDLFAGAGGMSEGFSEAGLELLGAIEIEKAYFETFKHNHKAKYEDCLITGDIRLDENKEKLYQIEQKEEVGLVVGGPPCQGFSYAGLRNPNDDRNQLFKEFFDVVDKVRPECFVMENVVGITTMRKGEVINEIKGVISSIGYNVNNPVKLFAEEYGVPQKRRRVFIIGFRDKKIDLEFNPLFKDDLFDKPNPITVYDAISSLPSLGVKDGEIESEFEMKNPTNYDKLMSGMIGFDKFYSNELASLKYLWTKKKK